MPTLPSLPRWLWIILAIVSLVLPILGYQLIVKEKPVDDLVSVDITVLDITNSKSIPNVRYEIRKLRKGGAPVQGITDANGFLGADIPQSEGVVIYLDHRCYKEKPVTINLQVDPDTTKSIYLEPKNPLPENC